MGYISSSTTVNVISYLTFEGRRLYSVGTDTDIIPKYFALGDSDNNYFVSATENTLNSGDVPDLTGNKANCIKTIAKGITLKYPLKSNFYPLGVVRTQFCEFPYTLKREISNGDGTFRWETTENSPSCGFIFKSQRFTKTISLNGSVCEIPENFNSSNYISITSNSPLVESEQGKFTGTTQDEADNKAIQWLNSDEAYQIALNNKVCTYTYQRSFTGTKNNCPQGEEGSTVTVTKTFSNNTGLQTEGDAWLSSSEPQTLVNQQGTCNVVGPQLILVNQGSNNLARIVNYDNTFPDITSNNTQIDLTLRANMMLTNDGTPFVMNTTSKYKIVLKLDRSATVDKTYTRFGIENTTESLLLENALLKPNSNNDMFILLNTPFHFAKSFVALLQNDSSESAFDSYRLYANDTINNAFNGGPNPIKVFPQERTLTDFNQNPPATLRYTKTEGNLPVKFKDNIVSEYVIDEFTPNIANLNKIFTEFRYTLPTSRNYAGTTELPLLSQTYNSAIKVLTNPNNAVKFYYEIYEYI